MPYIGKGANGFGIRETFQYTATSNQTAFTGSDINSKTLSFDNGSLVDVLLNGITLKPTTDYNTSTANTITLTSGATASDEVMIIVYDVFSLSDAMPKTGGTFTGGITGTTGTFSGAVTANSTLDMNGTELILDADADTSITSDTDDQIDFKTGGTDRMSIKSNGQIFIGNTSGTLPSSTMGVGSAGRHIIANDGAGFLLLQDNSTAAQNNGFDIHMGGVPAGTATLFSGGSIGGFVENASNADGYLKFSTSLNGTITEAMRINSDGIVTKVKNPHFIGGRQGTTGSVTGYTQGSGQNMIANIEQDDTGGHYNNTNGEFTCPATGVYQVNFHGFLHSGSGNPSSNYSIQIHLNASIMQYAYFGHVQGTNTYMSYSTSIRAAATNILTVKLMNGLWYSNDWRYFGKSICFLG